MDRFAFLASQPWLYPTTPGGPPLSRHASSHAVGWERGGVPGLEGEVPGFGHPLRRHLLLSPPHPELGRRRLPCSPVEGAKEAEESGDPSHPRVVFDGCASFHFSEGDQLGLPPSTPGRGRDDDDGDGDGDGDGERDDRPERERTRGRAVGAAAPDALHYAFASTEEWPDQAQFSCVIAARPLGENVLGEDDRGATWLEITVDGAAYVLDLSQARHVVAGPPSRVTASRHVASPRAAEPEPADRAARLPLLGRRPCNRRRQRENALRGDRRRGRARPRQGRDPPQRRQRRRVARVGGGGASGEAAADGWSSGYDAGGWSGEEAEEEEEDPLELEGRSRGNGTERGMRAGGRAEEEWERLNLREDEGKEADVEERGHPEVEVDAPPPYVSVVFTHVTLNLYHPPVLPGCRRGHPSEDETAKILAVRDALERYRAAAARSAAAAEGTHAAPPPPTATADHSSDPATISSALAARAVAARAVADAILRRAPPPFAAYIAPDGDDGEDHEGRERDEWTETDTDTDDIEGRGRCDCGAKDPRRCLVPQRLTAAALRVAEAHAAGRDRLGWCRTAVAAALEAVEAEAAREATRGGLPRGAEAVEAWSQRVRLIDRLDDAWLAADTGLAPAGAAPGESRL